MSSPPSGPEYGWQPRPQDYNSAPSYGKPPRQSRAGLIIVLIVVLVLVVLGAVGLLGYRLVSDHKASGPAPVVSVAPVPSNRLTPTKSSPPKSTPPKTIGPVAAVANLSQQFVADLNANNVTAASALGCKSSKSVIPTLMKAFLKPPAKLVAGAPVGSSLAYAVPLSGTMNGAAVSGVVAVSNLGDEPMCIRAFSVSGG
ncbi:hypothetical protein AB0E69_32250 [Kribbella sp. NPDC026611]|uniref:hypothetical protein n=1 Tax=Kribbella sp. NPDC026611 TaxID=3154911 RepID=UPI003403023A